jgi:hypothetical protein
VLAGRLDERLDALGSATVGAALELAVTVLVGRALAVAAVHRDGHQVRALAGLDDVLDRAAGPVRPVVFAVTGKSCRAAQRPAARIALDGQIVDRVEERLASRAAGRPFFYFFFLDVGVFSVKLLDSRAKW